MTVNKKLKDTYFHFFDNFETFFVNLISNYIEKKNLNKYMTKDPIPKEFKQAYSDYWKKYTNRRTIRMGSRFAWYYASQNGILSPKYIPNTLYYTVIDQYYNSRKLGWGLSDKNFYSVLFSETPQPKTLCRRINGILLNNNYEQSTINEAMTLICSEEEVICKPTLESGSGWGIQFWNTEKQHDLISSFLLDTHKSNYIVQKVLKQHSDLNQIHPSSINTIRIVSILMDDDVHILSSNLRMGTGGSRIDNVTAGGISAGIRKDGTLEDHAVAYYTGKKFNKHPSSDFVFKGFKVPSYDRAVKLVKKAHPKIAHFRLVSWDIAIDYKGDALLIEANMRKGGINLNQFSNGPLFGDLTERVLDEVFGK
jgi:hypothetical protein